jgi:hypothetical protein
MAFDPISWGAGFILTRAASKGLELTFPQTLRRDLEKEIENWASSVSETAPVHPTTLFSVISQGNEELVEHPALGELRKQLLELTMPTAEQWLEALFEQWSLIKRELGENAQEFFRLSAEDARQHLSTLSKQIYRRCSQDEKMVLPHVVGELDTIKVTLQDLRQLVMLRSVPSHFIFYEDAIKEVTSTAVELAMRKGWSSCLAMHLGTADKKKVQLIFGRSAAFAPATGVMEIDEERMKIWANLHGEVLSSALAGTMFGIPLFTNVMESWNSMVKFIGAIARTLYPNSVYNGWFGISARVDLQTIGVPVPIGTRVDHADDRITMMKLGDLDNLVPFFNFRITQLTELLGLGEVEAAGLIAAWLFSEWGPSPHGTY